MKPALSNIKPAAHLNGSKPPFLKRILRGKSMRRKRESTTDSVRDDLKELTDCLIELNHSVLYLQKAIQQLSVKEPDEKKPRASQNKLSPDSDELERLRPKRTIH